MILQWNILGGYLLIRARSLGKNYIRVDFFSLNCLIYYCFYLLLYWRSLGGIDKVFITAIYLLNLPQFCLIPPFF